VIILNHIANADSSKPNVLQIFTGSSFSMESALQFVQTGDLSRVLIIFGVFVGYWYLFHYLTTCGTNLLHGPSSENKKMGITFFYIFLLGLFLTIAIPMGTFLGFFGVITPTLMIEILILTYLLGILVLILWSIFSLVGSSGKPITYPDLVVLNQYLKKWNFSKKYGSITALILLFSFETIIFGLVINLNVIVVGCIIVLLLAILWLIGFFNAIPDHTSTIQLSNNEEISEVFVSNTEGENVTYLSQNRGWVHLNKDAVLNIRLNDQSIPLKQEIELTKKIQRFIFDADFWNIFFDSIMVLYAFIFAILAVGVSQNFSKPIIVLFIVIFGAILFTPFLWLAKKYGNRYWEYVES
jgi:hypothetical protein